MCPGPIPVPPHQLARWLKREARAVGYCATEGRVIHITAEPRKATRPPTSPAGRSIPSLLPGMGKVTLALAPRNMGRDQVGAGTQAHEADEAARQ